MYPMKKGLKHTIISFEPLFHREDMKGLTDAKIGKKLGLDTHTVRAMRYNQDVPYDTIRAVCHALDGQPGDVLKAITAEYFPAKKDPDA